jgi:hypothetical protein
MSPAVSRPPRPHQSLLRSALALATLVAVTTFVVGGAQAQAFRGRGPWCTAYFDGPGYSCSFYSYEQCWATASGLTNHCLRNPFYVPPPEVRPPRKRPRP